MMRVASIVVRTDSRLQWDLRMLPRGELHQFGMLLVQTKYMHWFNHASVDRWVEGLGCRAHFNIYIYIHTYIYILQM